MGAFGACRFCSIFKKNNRLLTFFPDGVYAEGGDMKHWYFIGLFLLIGVFSCKQKSTEYSVMELKELVLSKGDTAAFNKLRLVFANIKRPADNLVYAIIMAHRYNYAPAYAEIYNCLESISETYGNVMDDTTKEMALMYLNEGAALKDYNSLSILRSLYEEGIYLPKDTAMVKKLSEEMKACAPF